MSAPDDPSLPLRNLSALEETEARAFRRGEQSAALAAKVDSHERRLNMLNGSIDRSAAALRDLEKTVDRLVTITATRADDAKTAAEEGLSTRTFVFALVASAIGVCTVVIAALALLTS